MNKLLDTFQLFSMSYFVYLLLAIIISVALVLFLRKVEDKGRLIAKIALVSAIGLFFVLEYIGKLMGVEKIRLGNQLPLEYFDIFAIISIYVFFSKRTMWKKFCYLIVAPVSLYSIIFVPNVYLQMNSFCLGIFSFYILNSLLIANAILNMLWEVEDLEKKDVLNATINFLIIVFAGHLFNVFMRFTAWGVHANYLGTMGEDFDLVVGWLYSLISVPLLCILPLIAVLVGVEFLCVLPFDLLQTKRNKQSQIEELIALGNLKEQQEFRNKYAKSKSQILVRSETKAEPKEKKDVSNKSNDGFVTTTKEVKVNNETENSEE